MMVGIRGRIHDMLVHPLMVTKWLQPLLTSSPHKMIPMWIVKGLIKKDSLLANLSLFFFFLRKEFF